MGRWIQIMKNTNQSDKPSIFQVAGYFINKGYPLSLFQTIKLCYIAYGYVAGLTERKLFEEEFKAWKKGPSNSDLYESLKEIHKNSSIYKDMDMNDVNDAFIMLPEEINKDEKYKADEKKLNKYRDILNFVHDRYASLNGMALSALTHQKGTPWYKNHNHEHPEHKENIPFEDIKEYFKNFLSSIN